MTQMGLLLEVYLLHPSRIGMELSPAMFLLPPPFSQAAVAPSLLRLHLKEEEEVIRRI